MNVKTIRKYGDLISLVCELFVITLLAFFLTLMSCGFDFAQFDYEMFAMNEIFNIYSRCCATPYASAKERINNSDVVLLGENLLEYRRIAFKSCNQKVFQDTLYYYNLKRNYTHYYYKLSKLKYKEGSKKQHNNIDLMKKVDELINLLKAKNYEDFEKMSKEYGLYAIRNKYPFIKQNDLWCGQNTDKHNSQEDHNFNNAKASVGYALPSMMAFAFLQLLLAAILPGFNSTPEALIKLASYLLSIVMGTTWGLKNGKRTIAVDYHSVQQNNLRLIKELFAEANIPELNGAD